MFFVRSFFFFYVLFTRKYDGFLQRRRRSVQNISVLFGCAGAQSPRHVRVNGQATVHKNGNIFLFKPVRVYRGFFFFFGLLMTRGGVFISSLPPIYIEITRRTFSESAHR